VATPGLRRKNRADLADRHCTLTAKRQFSELSLIRLLDKQQLQAHFDVCFVKKVVDIDDSMFTYSPFQYLVTFESCYVRHNSKSRCSSSSVTVVSVFRLQTDFLELFHRYFYMPRSLPACIFNIFGNRCVFICCTFLCYFPFNKFNSLKLMLFSP